MSTSSKLPGAIVTALAAVALAAPGAGAMPMHESSEFDSGHASTAAAAATHQDLRSPDARDAALNPQPAGKPAGKALPGAPVWATNTQPIHTAAPSPVKNDDGLPWLTLVLGVAGGLAVGGAAAGASRTVRVRARRSRAVA
jgi:hypothetical protein